MANLAYRRESVARLLGSVLAPGASYTVTAYAPGARVNGNQTTATPTVDAGHGFPSGSTVDCIVVRAGAMVTGSFVTCAYLSATSVTLGSSLTLLDGDRIVNLGNDTGSTSPNYDGSTVTIYSDDAGTDAWPNSRVTCNSQGEYDYWYANVNPWELIRGSSGTVVDLVPGIVADSAQRINVRDYGAKGDNSTNDYGAIQSAINAALSLSVPEVFFPAGTYLIGTKLSIASATHFRLRGEPGSKIKWNAADSGTTPLVECTQCSFVTFDGLEFDGAWATLAPNTNGGNGIDYNYNSTDLTVINCTFRQINDTCIVDRSHSQSSATLGNTTDAVKGRTIIHGNRFFSSETCFNTKGGGKRYVSVQGNHVSSCFSGFKLDGETNVTNFSTYTTYTNKGGQTVISGNTFSSMGGSSASGFGFGVVFVEEYVQDVVISNNVFTDTSYVECIKIGQGQSQRGVDTILINGNTFSNTTEAAVIAVRNESASGLGSGYDYPTTFENIKISNNLFSDTEGSCIYLSVTAANVVKGFTINGNTFREWATLGNGSGPASVHCIMVYAPTSAEIRSFSVTGNTFERRSDPNTSYILQANLAAAGTYEPISFLGNRAVGSAIANFGVYAGSIPLYFIGNDFRYGNIYVYGTIGDIRSNVLYGVRVFADDVSGTPTTLHVNNNRFIKADTETFAVQLNDSAVMYDDGNWYDSGYTNDVSVLTSSTRAGRSVYSGTEFLKTSNAAQWIRGANSESITLSTSGLTTDSSANLLPANSIIEAVCCRVTTTITTTTNWAVGDPTTSARFSSANATLVSGTTSVGLNHWDPSLATTAATGPTQTSAAKVRITCTGSNPGAGVIRVTVFYRQFVAPTS